MVASGAAGRPPLAFDAIGPLKITPPKELDGKKENFEDFAFKLRAYLFVMGSGYEIVKLRTETS